MPAGARSHPTVQVHWFRQVITEVDSECRIQGVGVYINNYIVVEGNARSVHDIGDDKLK